MVRKKNKDINDKCKALFNRINIIKKEEEIYKKQLKNIKKREKQDRIIQFQKNKMKLELEKMKNEKDKELEEKRERIQRYKKREKTRLEEKKNENLSQKKRKYQSAMNDKFLMKCIIEQLNTQQNNKNSYKHAKIKQEINEFETNKMKQNMMKENQIQIDQDNNLRALKLIEKKMLNTCTELETIERQCLESLNKTKKFNIRYIENTCDSKSKYFYNKNRIGPIRHLNRSMDTDFDEKKLNNLILSPSISSKKHIDSIKDRFNSTAFTQSSSVSNFRTNRTKKFFKNESVKKNNISLNEKKKQNKSYINIKEKNKEKENKKKLNDKNYNYSRKSNLNLNINKDRKNNFKSVKDIKSKKQKK
jgi:hypothetical protein